MAKPKLIAFDLDYTLWPFWIDSHVDPPFKKKDGKVYDRRGHHVKHYRDVPDILEKLKNDGYKIAIASRTGEIDAAHQLVTLFNWDQYIHHRHIYPSSKLKHFKKFQEESGIPYKDMLFFDDEHRNIAECSRIGVTCVLVGTEYGVTHNVVREGLEMFASKP